MVRGNVANFSGTFFEQRNKRSQTFYCCAGIHDKTTFVLAVRTIVFAVNTVLLLRLLSPVLSIRAAAMETKKKFAIIKFDGHRKKLTYFSQDGKSDFKAVKDAILSSKDDAIYQNVKNCTDVIIEIFDTDVRAKVELSSNEVLDTVSELDVSFVYEVSQLPERDLISEQSENSSEILSTTSSSECVSNVIIVPSENTPYSSEFAVTDTSDPDTYPRQKRKNKSTLKFPVKLPEFPGYLRKLIDDADDSPSKKLKVLAKSGHFIRFWASDLLALTDGNPTPNDYRYYATSIATTFPLFADKNSSPHKSIVKQLSSCIRNRRAWERRTSGITTTRNIMQVMKPNIHSNINVVSNIIASPASSKSVITLMKEIKKLNAATKDISHAKILLRQTFSERREWIKNTAGSISAAANEFPILINPELLLFEYELMGHTTNFEEKWSEIMKKILRYFQITAVDENYFNSQYQIELILKIEKEVNKKKYQSIIIWKKIFEPTECLRTVLGDSPKLVIFLDGSNINSAYIVADGTVEIKLETDSLLRCLASLIATYYVFDTVYPKGYNNFLLFLDCVLMQNSLPAAIPGALIKVMRKWNVI